MNAVVATSATGGFLWAIRGHSREGGFFSHCDAPGDYSCSFHWPGFAPAPDVHRYQEPEEKEILTKLAQYAV